MDLGDDACVLPPARYAATTDALLEGVDFRREWGPPEALGHKALAANLSDLAAMGARPRFLLLTLGLPPDLPDAWAERMLTGMADLSRREGLGLCGGDLSATPQGLLLSLTLLGTLEHPPLLRGGGRPGDLLFVGGTLGGARRALRSFQSGARLRRFSAGAKSPRGPSLARFYAPPSQTALGLFLAETRLASCCIDLSDGLARDLHRICRASGCGAIIERLPAEGLCLDEEAEEGIREDAVRGGEDQVLLFAVPPSRAEETGRTPVRVHPIGHLTDRPGEVLLKCRKSFLSITPEVGHDHFASQRAVPVEG